MRKNEFNVTQFAQKHGVSRQVVYDSLRGNGSRRIRVNLAILLNKDIEEMFDYQNDKHKRALDILEYSEAKGVLNG